MPSKGPPGGAEAVSCWVVISSQTDHWPGQGDRHVKNVKFAMDLRRIELKLGSWVFNKKASQTLKSLLFLAVKALTATDSHASHKDSARISLTARLFLTQGASAVASESKALPQ